MIVLSFQKCKKTINTNNVLHSYTHIYTSLWLMVITCYKTKTISNKHKICQPLELHACISSTDESVFPFHNKVDLHKY